jgi:transposase
MIPRDKEADIARLARAEKWPVGTIAHQLGVHHSVVRRVLGQLGVLEAHLQRPSIADPYVPFIKATLEKYPKLHASRLYQMVKERGYPGASDHFRSIVGRYRPSPPAEAYLRLRTLPGDQAQVDWGSFGKLEFDGGFRKLYAFAMVLSFSRRLFARFYLSSAMTGFLQGHVDAYAYFGGVARTNLYDNLKSAVLERVHDAIRFHPTHLQLAGHYRFEPKPCNVARGNEKGRVERAIRYLRTSFFAARKFRDLADLNAQLERWLADVSDQRRCPEDHRRTVAEVFAEECPRLLTLPDNPFPADENLQVRVGKTPYIRFDRNDYSVPHTHVRKTLLASATLDTVRVLDGDQCVAQHRRCWDLRKQIEDPAHIQELLDYKQRAHENRGTDRLHQASSASKPFLCKVAERGGNLGATVSRLLKHLDTFGAEALDAALHEAVANDTPHLHAVRHLLDQHRHKLDEPPPLSVAISDDPRVTGQRVFTRDLSSYDNRNFDAENAHAQDTE